MYVIGDLYRVEQGDGTGVFFLAIGEECCVVCVCRRRVM